MTLLISYCLFGLLLISGSIPTRDPNIQWKWVNSTHSPLCFFLFFPSSSILFFVSSSLSSSARRRRRVITIVHCKRQLHGMSGWSLLVHLAHSSIGQKSMSPMQHDISKVHSQIQLGLDILRDDPIKNNWNLVIKINILHPNIQSNFFHWFWQKPISICDTALCFRDDTITVTEYTFDSMKSSSYQNMHEHGATGSSICSS